MPVHAKTRRTPRPTRYKIHVISDGTGSLADHLVNAVLTQFPGLHTELVYHVFQAHEEEVVATLDALPARGKLLVLHALVSPAAKARVRAFCQRRSIPCHDLTVSLVEFLQEATGARPVHEVRRLHRASPAYFRRIAALEFTAQHDDGRRVETLHQAEIVIVGLSRVSKSPTSYYLGFMGYHVANVAIAPETGFPDELRKLRKRAVALTMRPRHLYEIRKERFEAFDRRIAEEQADRLPYTSLRAVIQEVVWAEKECRALGLPIVDTTAKTVETTAAEVLESLDLPRRDLMYHPDA